MSVRGPFQVGEGVRWWGLRRESVRTLVCAEAAGSSQQRWGVHLGRRWGVDTPVVDLER